MKKILSLFLILLVLAGVAFGVRQAMSQTATGTPTAVASKPPTPVVVQTLAEQKIRLWTNFSGRLHAVDYAEIRPEVSGRIMEVRFEDGQSVKAGDILFVIDPRPYEAAVERAEASLTSAQSKTVLAKLQQHRAANLIDTHAIAQDEMDTVDNADRVAASDQENAEAMLKQAKLDLEHAYVAAPISGRVSRAEITVGNLVQSGSSAPLLTSIVSQNGIYADFEVDEQTYLQTIRTTANGNAQEHLIPVQLVAEGEKDHVYNGFIQNFDNRIDTSSGTIRARAKFENTDGALVPGMFVSVKLAGGKDREALLVPDRAVGFDQSKKFVYVVDAANKVSYREIELGKQVLGQRGVESGLKAGDRVVISGIQQTQPDDVVAPTEADPAVQDEVAKTTGP